MDKINILYEDNHVLVCVKPPNVPSQEDESHDPDMLTLLKADIKERYQKPGNVYLGLVQRLDRPVGGLMVFAKTGKAASRLSEQMRVHDMGREYLAVVTGNVSRLPEGADLTDYLIKNERSNTVTVCTSATPNAKKALLHYEQLAQQKDTALIKVQLHTGRKHQIRVQMMHAGFPLWGDHRYGSGTGKQQIALFGYRLTFEHPTTHDILNFTTIPSGGIWDSYTAVLEALR